MPIRLAPIAVVCTALLAGAAAAQPANAPSEDATGVVLRSTLGEFSGGDPERGGPVADVRPGETVTITGDCIVASSESLRVVLTLADRADSAPAGYRAVLATDQRIHEGNLQVRVPDVPEAEDQVFQVKVFQLGEEVPQICGAGAIRIGARPGGKVG
jgi:hypothetical protein